MFPDIGGAMVFIAALAAFGIPVAFAAIIAVILLISGAIAWAIGALAAGFVFGIIGVAIVASASP